MAALITLVSSFSISRLELDVTRIRVICGVRAIAESKSYAYVLGMYMYSMLRKIKITTLFILYFRFQISGGLDLSRIR